MKNTELTDLHRKYFERKYVFILLIIPIFLFQNCSNENNSNYDKSQNIEYEKTEVEIIVLKKQNFFQEIYSNGTIISAETSELRFNTNGQIKKLSVKEGQYVKKGQLLAKLDLADKQLELEKVKVRLANAKNSLETILIGQGYELKDSANISKDILHRAKIKSSWSLELLNLKEAENNLKSSYIRAPFSGVIADIKKQKYDFINTGDILCTLINNSKYKVEFSVFETDRNKIALYKKAEIQTLGGDTLFAKINQINPLITKGQFRVSAELNNTRNKTLSGMSVKIAVRNLLKNRLVVPRDAVVTRQNRDIVFTVNNGKAKWNYVTTGDENIKQFVIKEGLNEGDTVIISGNINLAHDTDVEIRN